MPICGIFTGQFYLGGDGKLWRWDIFNHSEHTDAAHYAKPPDPDYLIEQGFYLKIGGDKHSSAPGEELGDKDNVPENC